LDAVEPYVGGKVDYAQLIKLYGNEGEMNRASKSPRRVLETAFLIGELSLPRYAHRHSPKKFTQPQLFACLVLKKVLAVRLPQGGSVVGRLPGSCVARSS
jgi:hypothetical protein